MKYYSEEDLRKVIPLHYLRQILARAKPINVRFCRDCPMFEKNYWQKDSEVISGWCRRMSYYETMEDEIPFYVYVNSNSFCNGDDIVDEY